MTMKRSWIAAFAILACLMFAWATGAGRPYPATAGGVIDPTCTSSLPCIEYDNNGAGPGIRGVSLTGNGVNGQTKFNSTSAANSREGVFGNDVSTSGSFNSGVRGLSVRGTGVSGVSTSGGGVVGQTTSGTGVFGTSSTFFGVEGLSTNNRGVFGFSSNKFGVEGQTGGSGPAAGVQGTNTSSDLTSIAVRANGQGGPLFVGNNSFGVDVFTVDDSGNVHAHSFTANLAAGTGQTVVTYAPQASEPTIEDFGEAQLTNGSAYVHIDSRFAGTMAHGLSYLVFITPEGMTHGTLCVTQRTASGFTVQENQGGRSSVTFAYRIVARPFGNQAPRLPLLVEHRVPKLVPRVHN